MSETVGSSSPTADTEESTPRGSATTRGAIADAARRLFPRLGYVGTSVRAVASAAGVDPALVIRHFGSKEQLFLETVPTVGHFEHITAGPLEGLGRRLVAAIVTGDREVHFSTYRAMMRASDSPMVRERLLGAQAAMFLEPLAPRLVGPDAELRARLVAAQFSGLLDGFALLQDQMILEADADRLVALYGDAIQTLIDG